MKQKVVQIAAATRVGPITITREGRIALAKMITRQFDLWKLDVQTQLSPLGLSKNSVATSKEIPKRGPTGHSRDLFDRVAILLSIHKSLRSLFPQNREISYRWPTTPDRVFGGVSPVVFICKEAFSGLWRSSDILIWRKIDNLLGLTA